VSIADANIVNVALPTLGRDFGTSISTIQWVPTIYLLAFAAVIPASGWATERFGARRVWIVSLAVFLAGSLGCGLSGSVAVLIGFRVLQGLGGGMITPVGQAILARAAGPQRMGRVMSVIGIPLLLGPVVGPVIGGALLAITLQHAMAAHLPGFHGSIGGAATGAPGATAPGRPAGPAQPRAGRGPPIAARPPGRSTRDHERAGAGCCAGRRGAGGGCRRPGSRWVRRAAEPG
jgi:MFS family permease